LRSREKKRLLYSEKARLIAKTFFFFKNQPWIKGSPFLYKKKKERILSEIYLEILEEEIFSRMKGHFGIKNNLFVDFLFLNKK